jgi:hypothetical protein
MSLPKAIQAQIDAADAVVAQLNGEPPTGETYQNNEQLPPAPAAEPPPQNISPETQPQPVVPEETWQAKFFTLKGKYDAEVPRLHAQTRELSTQVQQLMVEMQNVKTPPKPLEPAKSLITEHDKEAFGSDLLDLIDRATESKVATFRDRESQLLGEIQDLRGKLGNVSDRQVVSDKDRFLSTLAQQVPDWENLNVDQGFLTWLAEVDPVYGLPRQAALNNAYESLDASRTANIFKRFKAETAPQQQQQTRPNLQNQVAPTRSRTSPAPATSSEKRIFSQGEIAQFYDEWRRGYIDAPKAEQMEIEIANAISEGRVR